MTKTIENETMIGALALALPKLEGAKKDASNPAFKRDGKALGYATLSSVIDALEPLKEHGLWFIQVSHERDNGACFETIVIHGPSAETMSLGTMFVPADKNNAHGFGSAQSYCRRYGLMAAFGLAAEDDDGNAAAKAPPAPKQEPQRKAKPTAAITDQQIDQMKALIPQQSALTTQIIVEGWNVSDLTELTAEQAAKTINRLKAECRKANPQHDEELNDGVPA